MITMGNKPRVPPPRNPRFLNEYARHLQHLLLAHYDVSRVLVHSGMAGSAREFFVSSLLAKILPSDVVVGSGEIVDAAGNRSKQQDIVLYRANFPVFDSTAESHVYLAEGVLATIEIKTKLDKKRLREALANVSSVANLVQRDTGIVHGRDTVVGGVNPRPGESDIRTAIRTFNELDADAIGEDPLLRYGCERIHTFVFAFESIEIGSLNKHLLGEEVFPDCLYILGKGIAAHGDGPIQTRATLDDGTELDGGLEKMKNPMEWLIVRLLWALHRLPRVPLLRDYFETNPN